jgi:Type II CAAX prenyl endopeptidase Rce1-like
MSNIVEYACKCAGAGVGTFFLCEGIVRLPFLKNADRYLPIPGKIVSIANGLKDFQNVLELPFEKTLNIRHPDNLYLCLVGPIIEELGNRLFFQEFCLGNGMEFCAQKLGLPIYYQLYQSDATIARVYRAIALVLRVGLSALVFAATHTWAFSRDRSVNPYGASAQVSLVAMGIILGLAKETTGSTAVPIAIHVVNNTMEALFADKLKKWLPYS